jgi:predicted nucleic acid-binding protein
LSNIVVRITRQISRKAHGILVKAKKQGLISELKPLILGQKEKEVWL